MIVKRAVSLVCGAAHKLSNIIMPSVPRTWPHKRTLVRPPSWHCAHRGRGTLSASPHSLRPSIIPSRPEHRRMCSCAGRVCLCALSRISSSAFHIWYIVYICIQTYTGSLMPSVHTTYVPTCASMLVRIIETF